MKTYDNESRGKKTKNRLLGHHHNTRISRISVCKLSKIYIRIACLQCPKFVCVGGGDGGDGGGGGGCGSGG